MSDRMHRLDYSELLQAIEMTKRSRNVCKLLIDTQALSDSFTDKQNTDAKIAIAKLESAIKYLRRVKEGEKYK